MLLGAFGHPTGFFAQYAWMDGVTPLKRYPAVERACAEADVTPVIEAMRNADYDAGFWRVETVHQSAIDTMIMYAVVRAFRPKRILEIGSGRSTQVLAKALLDIGEGGSITCIDPAPRLSIDDLPVTFHRRVLSEADTELASALGPGDILFIDSSHILQPGTDCDIQQSLMFPALAAGVIVHVHDIFLPFSYPENWQRRNWNEACGIATWIASGGFEVVFPNHFLLRTAPDRLPLPEDVARHPYASGGMWLRKR